MDYHQNARLTVHSREQMSKLVVERGSTLKAAAAAFNVSAKNRRQVGAPLSTAGSGGAEGSQFQATSLAPANPFHLIGKSS